MFAMNYFIFLKRIPPTIYFPGFLVGERAKPPPRGLLLQMLSFLRVSHSTYTHRSRSIVTVVVVRVESSQKHELSFPYTFVMAWIMDGALPGRRRHIFSSVLPSPHPENASNKNSTKKLASEKVDEVRCDSPAGSLPPMFPLSGLSAPFLLLAPIKCTCTTGA